MAARDVTGGGAAEPFRLTAAAASAAIAEGRLTAEALVCALLDRIAEREGEVRAWAHLDPVAARAAGREADRRRDARGGRPETPLSGIPIGVKDVIDVRGMPTECNSEIMQGYRPAFDAECVRVVRAAGAVILGKTETVEFAAGGRRAPTRNPHDPARSPGGSSSGSGAAVGDFHVPLAFGTQTAGSLIRPASYNGTYALKPSWGSVAWPGAKQYAPSLDTIGWYGREVADLALMASAYRLRGFRPMAAPDLSTLKVGICATPWADELSPGMAAALEGAAARLAAAGARVFALDLPAGCETLRDHHQAVMMGEGAAHFLGEYVENLPRLHQDFRDRVELADETPPERLRAALDAASDLRRAVEGMFGPDLDVILAPAALGEAPLGEDPAGAWAMNAWVTLLHLPALSIPAGTGPAGMPLGLQLLAPRYAETGLLAAAAAMAPAIDVA